MNPSPSDSQTFWRDGGRHDGTVTADQWPILRLAQVLTFDRAGATSDDLPGVLFNLWNSEREPGAGILRYLDVNQTGQPICTGFLAWGRISLARLARCEREDIRVLPQSWYEPAGAVAFITEALAYAPRIMHHGVRHVSRLPGVQIVCGWRRGRFRILAVRRGGDGILRR